MKRPRSVWRRGRLSPDVDLWLALNFALGHGFDIRYESRVLDQVETFAVSGYGFYEAFQVAPVAVLATAEQMHLPAYLIHKTTQQLVDRIVEESR